MHGPVDHVSHTRKSVQLLFFFITQFTCLLQTYEVEEGEQGQAGGGRGGGRHLPGAPHPMIRGHQLVLHIRPPIATQPQSDLISRVSNQIYRHLDRTA